MVYKSICKLSGYKQNIDTENDNNLKHLKQNIHQNVCIMLTLFQSGSEKYKKFRWG